MANRFPGVKSAHGEIRMTDGSLWKNMLFFSIPLMLSQLLQVLFNMADVAVVGKFSSAEALGAVNSFDSVMVEGNAAAANADAIIYNVMAAFYTACSSFMGQNLGAGKRERVLKSYFIGIAYSFVAGAVLGAALFFFGREFLSLFANEEAVIEAGLLRTRIMCFSYAFSAFMDCTIAACRGIGKSLAPTVIVIMGSCVFRVAWIYTVFAHFHTIPSLYLLYIFSWVITALAEIMCFAISYKKLDPAGWVSPGE